MFHFYLLFASFGALIGSYIGFSNDKDFLGYAFILIFAIEFTGSFFL
jgi:hypothetical protein